jgi:hypothetical protein
MLHQCCQLMTYDSLQLGQLEACSSLLRNCRPCRSCVVRRGNVPKLRNPDAVSTLTE